MQTEVNAIIIGEHSTPNESSKWIDPFESILKWSPELNRFGCSNIITSEAQSIVNEVSEKFETIGSLTQITFDLPGSSGRCRIIFNGLNGNILSNSKVEMLFQSELPKDFAYFVLEQIIYRIYPADVLLARSRHKAYRNNDVMTYLEMLPLALQGTTYPLGAENPLKFNYFGQV